MKQWAMVLIAAAGIGLAGCTQQTSNSGSASATSREQAAKDYLTGPKQRGLTVSNVNTLTQADLPGNVQATTAVAFTGESQTPMQVMTFKTQAAATTARQYYVKQQLRTYTDRRVLFTAGRTLGRDWFTKYQQAIFRQ